jgi:hypothetical protein
LGFSGAPGGVYFKLITIATLLYACCLPFWGRGKAGGRVALTGVLGLGLLAVNEVFSLAYIYLLHGDAADITVRNYSQNCAYLFFMAVVLYSLPESVRGKRILQISVNTLSVISMCCIFYGDIAGNAKLLYYPALLMMILCVWCATYLLISGTRYAKPFAVWVIAACALDSLNRVLIIFDLGWQWHDLVLSLYPIANLFIGFALTRLREGATDNG